MNEQEQKSILTLCLMAAFTDGAKHERERDEIKRVASSLAGDGSTHTLDTAQILNMVRQN